MIYNVLTRSRTRLVVVDYSSSSILSPTLYVKFILIDVMQWQFFAKSNITYCLITKNFETAEILERC